MATLTHYALSEAAQRTSTSASKVEVTQYTVAASTLTAAGFAAGNVVFVMVRLAVNGSSANAVFGCSVGRGSTYAGRTDFADSNCAIESQSTTAARGHHYVWFKKYTLVSGENWYTSIISDGTNTARLGDFSIVFLKLDDLNANDWRYDEQTHSGNAPTSYNTSGATVTLPGSPTSNWLVLSNVHWLIDDVTSDLYHALSEGGSDVCEMHWEGEDIAEERSTLVAAYVASVAADRTERTRYRTDTAASHDVDNTKIFALRLNAFVNSSGVQSATSITHTVVDTYQECAGVPAHPITTTGDHMVFALSLGTFNEATKIQRMKIQKSNVDWPVTSFGDMHGAAPHGAADTIPNVLFAVASVTAGTFDLDLDITEDVDVTPNYSSAYHTLVAVSMAVVVPTFFDPEYPQKPNDILTVAASGSVQPNAKP